MGDSPLIDSLGAAVQARPDDLPLRLHLAELLVGAGRGPEAIGHAAQILAREPGNAAAQRLMTAALGGLSEPSAPPPSPPAGTSPSPSRPSANTPPASSGPAVIRPEAS